MFKYGLIVFLFSVKSYAFLDFIADKASDAAEAAVYTDAVAELLQEIVPDTSVTEGSKSLDEKAKTYRNAMQNAHNLSMETKSVLMGPHWSDGRLSDNIRSTTQYIRRVKRLVARLTILGTKGATALNTLETNLHLQEVQRNQQAQLLIEKEKRMTDSMEVARQKVSWDEFIDRERRYRGESKW